MKSPGEKRDAVVEAADGARVMFNAAWSGKATWAQALREVDRLQLATRKFRSWVRAQATKEERAACPHADVAYFYGSVNGRCRKCCKPMRRPVDLIPADERRQDTRE